MKIFFADFKMLAAKVNDDNKNKKKTSTAAVDPQHLKVEVAD